MKTFIQTGMNLKTKERTIKMARDRERVCEHYLNEGNCRKGHEGTFKRCCQTCHDYSASKKGKPRRGDYREKRKEKILKRENDIKFYI